MDRTQLKFTIDNESYECAATAQILMQADRGQVWVYHDQTFKPIGSWTKSNPNTKADEFFTAASDSLNWWLP